MHSEGEKMFKRVTYKKYQVLRIIYNVTVITASDNEAVIFISK